MNNNIDFSSPTFKKEHYELTLNFLNELQEIYYNIPQFFNGEKVLLLDQLIDQTTDITENL